MQVYEVDTVTTKNTSSHTVEILNMNETQNETISDFKPFFMDNTSDEDKQVGMQVLELCIERDSLNEWVFSLIGGNLLYC